MWPSSEEKSGNNEQTNILSSEHSVPPNKCVLNSGQSLTGFSTKDEALSDKNNGDKDSQTFLQGHDDNVNLLLKKTKGTRSIEKKNRDVDRMAREGCVWIDKFASLFVKQILEEALAVSCSLGWSIKCSGQCQREQCREEYQKKESSSWWGVEGEE